MEGRWETALSVQASAAALPARRWLRDLGLCRREDLCCSETRSFRSQGAEIKAVPAKPKAERDSVVNHTWCLGVRENSN